MQDPSPSILKNRNFALFLIVNALTSLAKPVTSIALTFLILKMTGSASNIALALGFSYLPSIFVPFISTYLEQIHLKAPMIISCILSGLVLLILVLLLKLGLKDTHVIYILVLVIGVLSVILMPAEKKLTPSLIPPEHLEKGNSCITIASQVMSFIGFALGGALVAWIGSALALTVEGICYFIMFILIALIQFPPLLNSKGTGFTQELTEGMKYVFGEKLILTLVIMLFILNVIAAPFSVILPLHMESISKGSEGYGIFMSTLLLGGVVGGVGQFAIGNLISNKGMLKISWLLLSVVFLGFAIINGFAFCLLWAFLIGVTLSVLNINIMVLLQKKVPEILRARVIGTFTAISVMGLPITFLILAPIITDISLTELFSILAIMALIFTLISHFLLSRLD